MKTDLCTDAADPAAVDRLLLAHYGPYRVPKNVNLLDELLYFMLSTRTTTPACEAAFRAFKKSFPRHTQILDAPVDALAAPLRVVGLAQRRATDIRQAWRLIRDRFGRVTLAPLRRMAVADAEDFLLALPGVGVKVARCLLMFGLHAPVFAVDTHIWRLSQRLGWLPDQNGTAPHRNGVDAIQTLVRALEPVSLHVNLIFLGRDFCNAREQNCPACPLHAVCPSARHTARR
ncbi:MAG: endonuclease III [Verrucomicrobiota bacterium]|jgi:endonuclease III|nr:endonuclease III [Verrucomicrobiota bacterium]